MKRDIQGHSNTTGFTDIHKPIQGIRLQDNTQREHNNI